ANGSAFEINNTSVLNATTLGGGVTGSSLTGTTATSFMLDTDNGGTEVVNDAGFYWEAGSGTNESLVWKTASSGFFQLSDDFYAEGVVRVGNFTGAAPTTIGEGSIYYDT